MGIVLNKQIVAESIKNLKNDIGDFDLNIRTSPVQITLTFLRRGSGKRVCGFSLVEQPNCCGVLISTRTWVAVDEQGRGYAQEMMPIKEAIAKHLGYSCLSATVAININPKEVHILIKHKWKPGESFVNSRTRNTVQFFTKVLK